MLKLIRRKGSPYWYARGTVCGQRIYCSTGKTDKGDGEKFAEDLSRKIRDNDATGDAMTFSAAAEAYIGWRNPAPYDVKRIETLSGAFGNKISREITQHDLVTAANLLLPDASPATRNRAVMTPASAILHYAANNKWCDWVRVRKFREPEPKTRFVTDAHEQWLMWAVEGNEDRTMLIMWLFRQGDRIGDTLATRYEDCDLEARTVRRHISKTDRTLVLPLDDDICVILKSRGERHGRIFPWASRYEAERWIKRLCDRLEIKFTPHMARHTVGKRLSDAGASLRLIMDKLGHRDSVSSLRYQRGDIESLRKASNLIKKGA